MKKTKKAEKREVGFIEGSCPVIIFMGPEPKKSLTFEKVSKKEGKRIAKEKGLAIWQYGSLPGNVQKKLDKFLGKIPVQVVAGQFGWSKRRPGLDLFGPGPETWQGARKSDGSREHGDLLVDYLDKPGTGPVFEGCPAIVVAIAERGKKISDKLLQEIQKFIEIKLLIK